MSPGQGQEKLPLLGRVGWSVGLPRGEYDLLAAAPLLELHREPEDHRSIGLPVDGATVGGCPFLALHLVDDAAHAERGERKFDPVRVDYDFVHQQSDDTALLSGKEVVPEVLQGGQFRDEVLARYRLAQELREFGGDRGQIAFKFPSAGIKSIQFLPDERALRARAKMSRSTGTTRGGLRQGG